MKVYNIADVKKFLNHLDACEDIVELSTETGRSYQVGGGRKAEGLDREFGGKISSVTLNFRCADDCKRMVGFISGMQAS
ncbi:MAG: hypothetical protein VZQ80_04750 [Lachnospiraceae bacterium]|nr:hypothetical protein [Lachnospiraceae bacterium]